MFSGCIGYFRLYVQSLGEHLVCQPSQRSITSKLELLIPEGDDDGPKLELLIPERDDDVPTDFGTMPDLVLVNIMSHLSLPDRGRLAQTCHGLEASFCHPSLWNTVTITLHSGHNPNIAESLPFVEPDSYLPFVEPASYLPMVERFGAYFKDLTVVYIDYMRSMSCDCMEVIQCIARCCRYEILTLCPSARTGSAFETDLNVLAQLFNNQHLNSFTLLGEICLDIRVLLSSDKLKGCLERLSLYWHGGTPVLELPSPRWHGRRRRRRAPVLELPSPREMVAVASQFTQLRALYLLSSMISDNLIVSLCDQGRAPLQELGIKVTYEIRYIDASSWIRLRTNSPCLQVHLKVVDRIPDNPLFRFLVPEMAIASLSFIERSKCANIRSIADMFSSTLRKFVNSTRYNYGHDAELVYMVTKCIHLIHFEYNSALRADTIRELAGLRGRRWLHFLVNLDNVVDSLDHVSKKQLAADVALITRK